MEPTIKHQAAARRAPARSRSRRRLLLGGISVFLCLAVAGILFWLLSAPPPSTSASVWASINLPSEGILVEQNRPVHIQVSAGSDTSVTRIEVYADGTLISVQPNEQPPAHPLVLVDSWSPAISGRHLLVARAYNEAGEFADSAAVYVDVVPLLDPTTEVLVEPGEGGTTPSLNDIARGTNTTTEDILAANPGLRGTEPGAPLPEGTTVEVPRPVPGVPGGASSDGGSDGSELTGGETPLALPDGAPALPTGLTATADCTSTQLAWTDNATDETGYVLYRVDYPRLTRVATLPANATSATDPLPYVGEFRYQIAAVKGTVEALSIMAVATPPGTCVPPAVMETVTLSLHRIETSEAWDGLYCYIDFEGGPAQRIPARDFQYLTPDASGRVFDLGRQLPNRGQFEVAVPGDGVIDISGECWGMRAPSAARLGAAFSVSHPREDWDGRDLQITAGAPSESKHARAIQGEPFRLIYRIGSASTLADRVGLLSTELSGLLRDYPGLAIPEITPVYGGDRLPPPTDLRIERTLDICALIPVASQQASCLLGGLLGGGYPTLYWDWTGNATFPESSLTSYQPVIAITDVATRERIWYGPQVIRIGRTPIPKIALLPRAGQCGLHYEIYVEAVSGPQRVPSLETISFDSSPCPSTTPLVEYTVEFVTLRIARDPASGNWLNGEIEDINGDFCFLCTDRRLEIVGAFGVNDRSRTTATWGGDCATRTICLGRGDYFPAEFPVRIGENGPVGLRNHIIRVYAPLDQPITVWFRFHEVDSSLPPTSTSVSGRRLIWCDARFVVGPFSSIRDLPIRTPFPVVGAPLPGELEREGSCAMGLLIGGREYRLPGS